VQEISFVPTYGMGPWRIGPRAPRSELSIAEAITLTLKIGHDKAVKLGDQLHGEKLARIHEAVARGLGLHAPVHRATKALGVAAWHAVGTVRAQGQDAAG
jgi:hypothetical protein